MGTEEASTSAWFSASHFHFVDGSRQVGPRRCHSHKLPLRGCPRTALSSAPASLSLLCQSSYHAHRSLSPARLPQHKDQGLSSVLLSMQRGPQDSVRHPVNPHRRAGNAEGAGSCTCHAGASGSAQGRLLVHLDAQRQEPPLGPLCAPADLSSQRPKWASARVTGRHICH